MIIKSINVLGDTGNEYKISVLTTGQLYCTCPAWKFSSDKDCKHIAFARASLRLPAVV